MLDFSHIPTQYPGADVQVFTGTNSAAATQWQTWRKPRGKSMGHVFMVGRGGNGGAGAIGANSAAAGGGGGGSGSQITMTFPLSCVPDFLYLSLAGSGLIASYLSITPNITTNNVFALANPGSNGGAASGATAGAAGAAAGVPGAGNMPLGWQFTDLVLAGTPGQIGKVNVDGVNFPPPTTGLLVSGGTGGGGLPAAGFQGTIGGMVYYNAGAANFFPNHNWLQPIATTATTPPGNGDNGYQPIVGMTYFYGGGGGGSTHGSATGAGLVQSNGGNGAYGCGGGGTGGALTGSTPGVAGLGGPALCIITCW